MRNKTKSAGEKLEILASPKRGQKVRERKRSQWDILERVNEFQTKMNSYKQKLKEI